MARCEVGKMYNIGKSMRVCLIHIGDKVPVWFFDCCEQVRRFFPGPIDVIIPDSCTTLNAIQRIGLNPIPVESLMTHEIYRTFKNNCYLEGFWNVTMGRLYLLEIYMRERRYKDIIHIENDVLIYQNPGNMLNEFKKLAGSKILLTPVGDQYATAAYAYIPHYAAISKINLLMTHLMQKGKDALSRIIGTPDINEMMLLAHIWKKHTNVIKYLPIAPSGNGSRNLQLFNSVFDGASIGQFLGGTHGEPGVSWTGSHHWAGDDLESGKYKISFVEHKGLQVPYITYGPKVYRINNLHIHSKRLKEFM